MSAEPMVEIHRGSVMESWHSGHAVICDTTGQIVESWGDPEAVTLPRSSAKMIQALPLVSSGAAAQFNLSGARLALACASHEGAPLHRDAVAAWLADIDRREEDLCCGPQPSRDKDLKLSMIRERRDPHRLLNNCSGKHTGFLTLARHLGASNDYVDLQHPVQQACLAAFEEVTSETSPGHGIDGCSAPNFACSMAGMARAMAYFAGAADRNDTQSRAADTLVRAMIAFPMMVAGQGRACTLLMQAARERLALKTGAEGYFVAILPDRGLGIALKISDGATRASECAITALLVRLGVLDADHPDVARFLNPRIRNWDGLVTGEIRAAASLSR